jgi:hypothetical protein
MIAIDLPEPLRWTLRWLLFLGPSQRPFISAPKFTTINARSSAAPSPFFTGWELIFATHVPAIAMGWCRHGGKVHMVGGIDMSMNLKGIPYLRLNRNRRGPLTV